MRQQKGWSIIERDLIQFRNGIIPKLAYLDTRRSEYLEAKTLYIGIDKVLNLINDYESNKVKALETLEKISHPDLVVPFYVDNE